VSPVPRDIDPWGYCLVMREFLKRLGLALILAVGAVAYWVGFARDGGQLLLVSAIVWTVAALIWSARSAMASRRNANR
jgi:hypothetical protein